jgi:hypothetical protein
MSIKYTWLDYQNGCHELHACGCNHTKKHKYGQPLNILARYDSTNLKDLCREVAIEFNSDFAQDNGVTAEEYVDSGEGYEVSTTATEGVRIMPCVRFANTKEVA